MNESLRAQLKAVVPATEELSDKWGTPDHAAQMMLGELLEASLKRTKRLLVPWSRLSEAEQATFLREQTEDLRRVVRKAVNVIAGHGRVVFRAQVEAVNFKAESAVKATLSMMAHAEAHALADTAGGYITVVVEDLDELLAIDDALLAGEPEQVPLFDRSQGAR